MRALYYTHKSPDRPKAIARLVNGTVVWTGLEDPASLMVRDPETLTLLRPSDGEQYLRALPTVFRNAYAWIDLEEDNFNGE